LESFFTQRSATLWPFGLFWRLLSPRGAPVALELDTQARRARRHSRMSAERAHRSRCSAGCDGAAPDQSAPAAHPWRPSRTPSRDDAAGASRAPRSQRADTRDAPSRRRPRRDGLIWARARRSTSRRLLADRPRRRYAPIAAPTSAGSGSRSSRPALPCKPGGPHRRDDRVPRQPPTRHAGEKDWLREADDIGRETRNRFSLSSRRLMKSLMRSSSKRASTTRQQVSHPG
jgi:hypothetical protein